MAPKGKSDVMTVEVPADKNEKSTRSGGNDLIVRDHYQKILNNRQQIIKGKNADIQPPLEGENLRESRPKLRM